MLQQIPRRLFLALTGSALITTKLTLGAEDVPAVLDHILLGCNDLDGGISFVEEGTGVRAAIGGVHPGRGTRNALLSLGEKHYLEIIAPDPGQPEPADTRGLRQLTAPRLIGWAAHPGNIEQFAGRLRGGGVAFEGPTPGSRMRPDGRLLQWKTLALKDDYGVMPFFIEWSPSTTHPSVDAPAGCKIAKFTIFSPQDAELRRLCSTLDLHVGIKHAEKPGLEARILGGGGRVMQLHS